MKIQKVSKVIISSIAFLFFTAGHAMAVAVDNDGDGLIEINNLDDLNEIRNSLTGKSLRGSSQGCPIDTGCFGYEMTRDLDFDTNGNGSIDSADWNSGNSWQGISHFNAVFEGNSHTISHLTINNSASVSGVGLFGYINGAEIKNLGLLNSNIINTQPGVRTAALVGTAFNLSVSNCYVTNAVVSSAGGAGGLLAYAAGVVIKNSSFSGNITANNPWGAGGLVGQLVNSSVESSFAKGSMTGERIGGLIQDLQHSSLKNSYANMQIVANSSGGLVEVVSGESNIDNTYALGSITDNDGINSGGLISRIAQANSQDVIDVRNSYSRNKVVANNIQYAIGIFSVDRQVADGASFTYSSVYYVEDPEGSVMNTIGNMTQGGYLLSELNCIPELFKDWDVQYWDFGDAAQLPALKFTSNFPWISTDTSGGNGDYESIARLKDRYPEYTCDSPTNFHAKEKNTGYIFKTKTPDVLRYFNITQGLACVHADQTSGSCGNYEVSYLCSNNDVNSWTAWRSSDANNGNGDYETHASGCATTPLAIKARLVGKTSVHYSPQQKLNEFNIQNGLTCLNSDNNCRDYQVRMVCDILGDR